MGGRLDRDEVGERLDPEIGADEAAHVGQLLVEHLGPQVPHVEVHEVLAVDPPAGGDLLVDAAAHDVAAGQVLHGRGVALHEALALAVDQEAALPAHRLREQEAELVHAGRVELVELHVLERQAPAVDDRHPVPGEGVGVAGDLEDLAEPAGGEEDRLGQERMDLAGRQLVADDAGDRPADAIGHLQVEHLVLVVEGHLVADALLIEGLQDVVPRSIGRVARPPHGTLAVVAGVAAEAPLVDQPLGGAVERESQVLQVDDRLDRVPAHHLGGVLVDEVVTPLDRVEPVPLPVVLLGVPKGGAHATLGRRGVGSGGIELADDADAGLRPEVPFQLQGRIETGATGTDHERVEVVGPRPTARRRGIGQAEAHENGPTNLAVLGSKVATTRIPSRSQTKAAASMIPTRKARRPPRST